MAKLRKFLGECLDTKGKVSFELGSELWEENDSSLLKLVDFERLSFTITPTLNLYRLKVHLETARGHYQAR